MKKVSQLLTLLVSAVTLVILLIFIAQSPDYSAYVTDKEMKASIAKTEKVIEEKMGEVENLNGIDALNEKYTQLQENHDTLQSQYDELLVEIDTLKKANAAKPKETAKEPVKTEKPKEQVKEPEVLKTETVTVISDYLNFRNEASLSAPIQNILPNGTTMEVLDKTVLEKDGHKWVKVGLSNGEIGYIAREYVK